MSDAFFDVWQSSKHFSQLLAYSSSLFSGDGICLDSYSNIEEEFCLSVSEVQLGLMNIAVSVSNSLRMSVLC